MRLDNSTASFTGKSSRRVMLSWEVEGGTLQTEGGGIGSPCRKLSGGGWKAFWGGHRKSGAYEILLLKRKQGFMKVLPCPPAVWQVQEQKERFSEKDAGGASHRKPQKNMVG